MLGIHPSLPFDRNYVILFCLLDEMLARHNIALLTCLHNITHNSNDPMLAKLKKSFQFRIHTLDRVRLAVFFAVD